MSTNPAPRTPPRILTIAGSDSSGGAGIQADIKTITMLGGYGMSAITALTAQNTLGVDAVQAMAGEFVRRQIDSCIEDIGIDAVKIGMLPNADVIGHVASALSSAQSLAQSPDGAEQPLAGKFPIILDPVMVATSGARLIDEEAVAAMRERLFPLATLITPNLPELAALVGRELSDSEAMKDAAFELSEATGAAVLAKGGHLDNPGDGERVIDVLVVPDARAASFDDPRIVTRHTHGTGCTLSSAIATLLGHGQPLEHAVRLARKFVRLAIENAPGLGGGNGPLGHQAVRSLS